MKKIESEYRELYGDIPKDEISRFKYLLDKYDNNRNIKKYLSDRIKDILNIKWKHEKIIIYLIPKATPRPRHNMIRNTFYVIGAKDNKDIFLKFMKNIDIDIITTPCKFTCMSYLPIPKQMNPIETVLAEMGLIRPITKPDWDNLGKTYSDMIQGSLLYDDSLIIEGISKKFYSIKPRIEIYIDYMESHDCKYNEKKLRKKVK